MTREIESEDDGETIEKVQDRVKRVLFKVNNHLLKHLESLNQYIYYILILIETLQILWFSIHPSFTFVSNSIGIKELQTGIRYFSIEYYMRTHPGAWSISILVAFVVVMIHLLTLVVTGYFIHRNSSSETSQFMSKISNFQIIVMNTVLTGPLFNAVAVTMYCHNDSPYHFGEVCYTPVHIVYCVLAGIVGIVLVIEGGLFGFLYFIKNPFSRGCLSTPTNIYYIVKFWLKTLPSLYFLIDSQLNYIHVYIFAFVIVFAGYIFLFRMFTLHTYDQKYHYFVYSCEISLTWMGLVTILQFYLSDSDRPNLSLIFSLFGILPLCYTFIKLERQSKKKVFLEGIRNIKKNKEVSQQFIYMIISLIETISVMKNKVQLLGFMKIHNGGCDQENQKCICHEFFESFYSKKKISPADELHIFHEFLKSLLKDYIKKFSGHVIFKIMYSYLLFYKLDSKIQSIHSITETKKEKLTFAEDFLVYRLKLLYEEESQEKQNDVSQDKGHAIKVYIKFNNLFMELESEIESCAKNHLEYWRELAEDFPSVLKLWNLAKHFEEQAKNAHRLYNKITEIYPNNIMTLLLYSNFLKCIALDQKEYEKLKDKIKVERFSSQGNNKDSNDMKFRENSNLCTITITAHSNTIGIILNVNSQLQRMLGYSKSQVLGQKLTKIMPKSYYDLHDGFITKHLNRADKEIESKEFTVFALCKKGFLVECNILTKLVPEIENGFHMIGFMKKAEETSRHTPHYIMYDGDNYNIESISESCVSSLGLTSDNIERGGNASQITVNYLFPEVDFDELDHRPELKLEGFQTILDQRVLSDDFVPFQSSEHDLQLENRSWKANVKLYMAKENTYGKLKLKFIKFFLLREEDDHPIPNKKIMLNQVEDESFSDEKDECDSTTGYSSQQKKYNQFVSESSIKCLIMLLVAAVYVFMAMEIALVTTDVSYNIIDSNEILSTMDVLNHSSSLLNYIKNSNFDTRRLQLTYKLNISQSVFHMYQKRMNESAYGMQNAIVQFIRILVHLDDKYAYRPDKMYDTYYFYNGEDPPITQTFQYNDAIFQYITTIISFSGYTYSALNRATITNTTILSNFFFVEKNGMTRLDNRTITNQVNIYAFFKDLFNHYVRNRQVLLGFRLLSVMIIFCLVLPVIIKLNTINHKLISIYNMIPLEDIRVIEEESWKFLTSNFEETSVSKIKQKDILIQSHIINKSIDSSESPYRNHSFATNAAYNHDISELSPASSLRPAETSDALLMSIDEEKVSLRRKSLGMMNINDMIEQRRRIPKVKLSQIPSNRNHIIFFSLIVIILFGYCVGEYFLHNYMFAPYQDDQDSLYSFKTGAALCKQVMIASQEYLINASTIDRFKSSSIALYTMVDALYSRFSDTNRNRQTIYGSIQQLKTQMNTPNMSILSTEKYHTIQTNMDRVQSNLIQESIDFIHDTKSRIKDEFQKICIVKFVVEVIIVSVLIKVLLSGYLEKVKVRTYRSTAMALMIPIKVIVKNEQILARL